MNNYGEVFVFGDSIKKFGIHVEFTETMLGSSPLDKDIYSNYILSKREDFNDAENNEEIATLPMDKGKTGFHRNDDGTIFVYNYHWKGCFKEACQGLARIDGSLSKGIKAYRKIIHDTIFVFPRRIPIVVAGEIGTLERPLRASTPQGERVALAQSETVPAGSTMDFEVHLWEEKHVDIHVLNEWLSYAGMRGWGQWRTGGFGAFEYTIAEIE